jgi:hypothetical protein
MTELAAIRSDIIEGRCPVLLDLADAALALDLSPKTVEAQFDNMVMAPGRDGDRCLIRAAEVRVVLLANRPKSAPVVERVCKSCGDPLPAGARRFCSPLCARMTPTARAAYLVNRASKSPAFLPSFQTPNFAEPAAREQSGIPATSVAQPTQNSLYGASA